MGSVAPPLTYALVVTDEAGFTYRFNAACRLFGAQPNADLRARLMAVVCQAREGPDADTLTITNTLYPDLDTQTALALFKALSYGMRFTKIRIHDIQLKDTGMNAALQAISRHPGVTVLEMRKTGATVASVPLLRRFIAWRDASRVAGVLNACVLPVSCYEIHRCSRTTSRAMTWRRPA